MEQKIKAYLSHRREDGGPSEFARFLIDNQPEDIELRIDCRDARLSWPIDEFMGELSTSSSVVFLLNREYFQSPWCMGELYAFRENRNPCYHGVFLACNGWIEGGDVRAFFAKQEELLTVYWGEVATAGETDDIRGEARRFRSGLSDVLGALQRMNFKTEGEIRRDGVEPIWQLVREQRGRDGPGFGHHLGESLGEACRRMLEQRLNGSSAIRLALAVDCGLEREAGAMDVVDNLWNGPSSVAEVLDSVLSGAEEALRVANSKDLDRLEADVLDILGLSLLGALDLDAHRSFSCPQYPLADTEFMSLSASSEVLVEVVHATLSKRIKTKLTFNRETHRIEVPENRRFLPSKVEKGRARGDDAILDELFRLIWRVSLPHATEKRDGEYLLDEDFDRLNKHLKSEFNRGHGRYFLVSDDHNDPLNAPGVMETLKYRLPYLFAYRFGAAELPSLLVADFGETDIKDRLAGFARLFD